MIRAATPTDIPACARIVAENPLWQRYGETYDIAFARFQSALEENALILVSEDAGEVTGFVWVVLRGAFDRSAYIPLIGVHPGKQGRGTGAQLIAAAEEQARAARIEDLFLLSSDFNTRAHAFYRRSGYAQVGAIPDYVLPGIAELIFRKKLG